MNKTKPYILQHDPHPEPVDCKCAGCRAAKGLWPRMRAGETRTEQRRESDDVFDEGRPDGVTCREE